MFKIFNRNPRRRLEMKFETLMSESYRLSDSNRELSLLKSNEAFRILKQIEEIYGE